MEPILNRLAVLAVAGSMLFSLGACKGQSADGEQGSFTASEFVSGQHYNAGSEAMSRGDYEAAYREFESAIRVDYRNQDARIALAELDARHAGIVIAATEDPLYIIAADLTAVESPSDAAIQAGEKLTDAIKIPDDDEAPADDPRRVAVFHAARAFRKNAADLVTLTYGMLAHFQSLPALDHEKLGRIDHAVKILRFAEFAPSEKKLTLRRRLTTLSMIQLTQWVRILSFSKKIDPAKTLPYSKWCERKKESYFEAVSSLKDALAALAEGLIVNPRTDGEEGKGLENFRIARPKLSALTKAIGENRVVDKFDGNQTGQNVSELEWDAVQLLVASFCKS